MSTRRRCASNGCASSTARANARPSAPRRPAGRPLGHAAESPGDANAVPRRVAILVYDGVTLLDVAGPAEVFKEANRFGADYRIVLVSPNGEDVMSNLGFGVAVDGAVSSEPAPDTYLVAGSDRFPRTPVPRALAEAARVPAAGPAASRRSAPARSSSPLPVFSPENVRPRIGGSHGNSPPDARRAASNPTRSTSVTATPTRRQE